MLKKIGLLIILTSIAVIFIYQSKLKVVPSKITNKIEEVKNTVEDVKETIAPKPTQILSTGLPDKHLIKTTFVPQSPEHNWDQPWQDACEEAALLTVNYFYKNQDPNLETIRDDILKMIDFENTQKFTHDMNLDQMSLVVKKYLGFDSQIIENPSIEEIKKYISLDIPVVVPANGKTLFKENKHFTNGGPYYHNLTILGFDDNKKQFIVHDVGTKSGAYFKYSYQLLIDSIHDFPSSNNKEDIDNGSKRVLILLK